MNTHTRAVLGFVFAAAIAGCSGSGGGDGSGSVNGTVSGSGIKVASVVSTTSAVNGGTVAAVILTSADEACTEAQADNVHPNQDSLLIELADVNGSAFSVPTAAATYAVINDTTDPNSTHIAEVIAALDNAQCQAVGDETDDSAASGSIVLTKVNGLAFTGTFDITLGTGDELKGDFDSEECDLTGSGSGSSTCM